MLIWLKLEVSMFHHSVTEFIFNCIKWNYLDLWPAYKTWPWYQSLICSNFLSVFLSLKYWAQSCEWCNKNSLTVDFGSYIYLGQNFEIPHSSENENLLCACMSKTLINCLQLFWTKPSGTATLRKLKAINNNHTFSNLYLLMLPSHATSQVGLIVLHSIRSLCADVGCAFPSGGSVDKSLQEIQKNHETSIKTYQKSPLYRTKRVIKSKKKNV